MVYENLTSADFRYYKEKLKKIEDRIEPVIQLKGFVLDRERYYAETLAINLSKTDSENLVGNISFQYVDRPGVAKFNLSLVKAQDRDNFRFFKKKSIHNGCTVDFFEKNVLDLLEKAFQEYDSINAADLDSKLELPQRYHE